MKYLKVAGEKIKDIDQLGDEFKITQDNRGKYSTIFGGILSFIAYVIAISTILVFIKNYFDTTNPEVSETFQKGKNIPKIDMYAYKHAPYIHVRKDDTTVPVSEIPKYFTISLLIERVTRVNDIIKFSLEMENYIPCALADKELNQYFFDSDIFEDFRDSTFCPSPKVPENYYLEANIFKTPYTSQHLMIMPCSLPNREDCKSDKEIEGTNVFIGTIDVAFDPSNIKAPISFIPNSDFMYTVNLRQQF